MNIQYGVLRRDFHDAAKHRETLVKYIGARAADNIPVKKSHFYGYFDGETHQYAMDAVRDALVDKDEVVSIIEIDLDSGDVVKFWNKNQIDDFIDDNYDGGEL